MKSKKKKRLLILIGVMLICLLPITLLSKVLVPWAEELGEVTTEAGAAPPGDATATDAVTDEKEGQLVNISDPILSWKEVQLLYAPQPHQETQFPHIHDFYYGRFYKTSSDYVQATLYCIAINASDKAYATHGYCYQHGVSTDNYGTVLSAVDGHSQFISQDSYTNIAKALAYAKHWTPMPGVVWNGFTSDGGDNEHTKNDNAVVALACSYFSGASEETSKASTIYGYGTGYYGNSPRAYIDALNAISYKDLPFLVDGVNGVSKGKRCGVTGRTKADKSEDGLLMSDVLTVDASSDLVWNYAIPANYKFRVYTNAELTQYTDYNAGSTVSLRGGNQFRVYANPIVGNKTVTFDFGNNTKYIMYLTCWVSPGGLQNVVTGDLSFSPFSFQLEWEGTSHVVLKKTSSNPTCTNNNPLYDLAGTTYTIYNQDGTPATTIAGTPAVLTCKGDGTTNILEMPIGSYKVKETKVGKGYLKNDDEIPITLTAANTADNPYVINTTDTPTDDPITVALTKSTNSNKPIRGAVYCIEYYPGIQTYSESEARTKHTGSVSKWYFETDANGEARFSSSAVAVGYNSSPFFTNVFGKRTIPLGTVVMYEEKAPANYTKSATRWVFQVRQSADGQSAWLYGMKDGTEVRYENGTTVSDTNAPKFTESPIHVRLPLVKAYTDKNPQQGDYGDTWVPNAELTIYKAMDKAGHIAIGEDGKPVVLEARDESGKTVKAVWVTAGGIKKFDKVPAGWYVIRETKAPTEDGYATCADKVVYVGNDETIAPGGKMTISGDETVYYSFSYDKDGVTIANVAEYEYNTKNGKVALYDKPITVELSKIDSATEKELPGAVLTLYRMDNDGDTKIETWTSTSESHVIKYLTPGRYKLHEDTVPLGYYTTQNTIEFDVYDSEEIQKCVMINHPIEVTFDKQSVNLGGASVKGATLALYRVSDGPAFATATDATTSDASSSDATVSDATNSDAEGLQLVERWVSDGTPHTIKYLTPGDYRLIEEKTPYGYTTSNSIDFSISDQKAAEAAVMYDEPIKCYVQIFKHGEMLTTTEIVECEYGKYTKFKWEDAPMSQISFDVYDEDGNLVDTIVTDENGTGISKELAFGSYKIKERVPDGWVDNHVVYNVKFTWLQGMTETNLTASVTINNESCNTQININKVGEEAVLNNKGEYEYVEKPLKGVLFGIYAKDAIKDYSGKEIAAADTCVGYAVTDSNGVASCDSKLVRGEYYYKELKTAGPQFVMDEDLHPFTLILANSKISTFNVNETLPIKNVLARGNIKVLKVNKDGRAPLAGAEFDVFNADGKIVDHLVTGADGTAMTKVLPYGKYSLRETKAPTGFVLSKATFDTEIIANGDVPLLEITNSTITKLGSKGIFIVVGLAVIFAGLVTVICFKLRRK